MNEIITGMQAIKMYAWEGSFAKMLSYVRRYFFFNIGSNLIALLLFSINFRKEVNIIRQSNYIRATLGAFISFMPQLCIFITIVSYILMGNQITASKTYIVTSMFNMLSFSMVEFWPLAITVCSEGYISVKRVQEYLLQGDYVEEKIKKSDKKKLTNGDLAKKKLMEKHEKNHVGNVRVKS